MKTWYEHLGFRYNPFSIKPIYFDNMIGYKKELKEIISGIKNGKIISVKGDYGLGKTTIMNMLIEKFGGRKKLVVVSCNRFDDMDIDDLIVNAGGFFKRITGKKERDLILVLDESHDITEDELKELYDAYMDNYFKSIVFMSAHKQSLSIFSEKIINVELKGINVEQAIRLVKKRLDGLQLISDDLIKKVYNISGGNPRLFLSNCEDVCRNAFLDNAEFVEERHLAVLA